MRLLGSAPVLAVHDLAHSADWYRRVLDCETSEPDPGNWLFCRAGDVTFMLGRCPDALPASELGDHSYVAYLYVDGVDEAFQRAQVEGATILKTPRDEPWGRREMALRSPDGHRFMLGEAIDPSL
jgi:predicted enzyme related to lactoylglutathione lyase